METGLAILREIKPYIEGEEKTLSKSQLKKKAKSNRKKIALAHFPRANEIFSRC